MQVYFKQTPGIVYDLGQILLMKLNTREKWLDPNLDPTSRDEELSYINYWLNEFKTPSKGLRVFFYLKNPSSTTFFESFMCRALNTFGPDITHEQIIDLLSEPEEIAKEVANFYFNFEKNVNTFSLESIAEELRQHEEISDDLKFDLLSFFINTNEVVHELKIVFYQYYVQLDKIYEQHSRELSRWEVNLGIDDTLVRSGFRVSGRKNVRKTDREFVFSPALFARNDFWFHDDQIGWYVLGVRFKEALENGRKMRLDLAGFGMAISEQMRITILELLLEHPDLNQTQIARELGYGPSAQMYNIDWLRRTNVIYNPPTKRGKKYRANVELLKRVVAEMESWVRGDTLREDL